MGSSEVPAFTLHPDRFFDADATVRRIARDLYAEMAPLPLVCPHGHVDPSLLSEDRAFAVKHWLEKAAPNSFPEGRVKVIAHGQTEPVASNADEAGRAKNRRVVIVLGTSR